MPRRLAVYQLGRGSAPVVVVSKALPLVAVNMLLSTLHSAERVQNSARCERHVRERLGAQWPQRVVDRVHDRARRAVGAGLARALGAQFRIGGGRDHMADLDIGHLGRHRYQIVRHVAVQELAALVVEAVLEQRAAQTLHDAAADLLVDQLWIDHRAAVFHAPVLDEPDEAGLDVYFEIARLDAVGEGKRPGARHVVARRHQLGLEARRQRVRTEIGDAGELRERQALGAGGAIDYEAVADVELVGRRLQDAGGAGEHVRAQRLAGLPGGFAADAGGARGPGAAAIGRVVGVAGDNPHLFDRHTESGSRNLRDHGLGTLALLGDSGLADDRALRVELHGDAVLRRDLGAADAVEGRRGIGHLDETRKTDAAMNALRAQPLLLGPKTGVVHHGIEMGQRLVVRQRLELDPGRAARRVRVVGNEVAAPDLERVHADLGGGKLDQPFGYCGRDGMADGAVLAHHVLVLEHHPRAGAVVRAGIGSAGEIDDLVRLDAGRARIDGVGADAGEIVDLPGSDGAVVLDADLRLNPMVAGMNVGDEAFDTVGDELDRALEQLRQRHRRHLVGIGVHLDAERAADILGHDTNLV